MVWSLLSSAAFADRPLRSWAGHPQVPAGLRALHAASQFSGSPEPGSAQSVLHPSPCSRRGLAEFGNPCAAHTKGQLTFCEKSRAQRKFSPYFPNCIFLGKGNSLYGSGSPCPHSHTCVSPVGIPMLTAGCTTGLENFPLVFWKTCSGKLAPLLAPSSNLLGLLSLLSFQSWCFVAPEILEGTHCAASWLLCLAAHPVPWDVCTRASQGLSPPAGTTAALWGPWGAHVTELPAGGGRSQAGDVA